MSLKSLFQDRSVSSTHQRGLTQEFASFDQVPDSNMKIGIPTAPVGDLRKWVCRQYILI